MISLQLRNVERAVAQPNVTADYLKNKIKPKGTTYYIID